MSDVSIAPQAPDAPAPVNEVPINPNPSNSPNPVTNEPPPADKAPQHPRREAIERAYDRAANPQKAREAKPAAKVAEAKKGHNQPPEDTPDEFSLKKRPSDQPRGERGQFAPRQDDRRVRSERSPGPDDRTLPGQDQNRARLLPEGAPYRDPPARISDRARQDWDKAPESVRGDYHRMHAEFEGAYRRYRGDHETMNTIRPYHELATRHGTTLDRALNNYVTMEEKLRADPIGGIELIVHNLNLVDPETGRRINSRDVAYHILSQSPEQLKATQNTNANQAAQYQIGALHQEVTGLKSYLQQMHTQQQYTYTRSAVDQYALDHPRLDEVSDLIEREIALGFDLDTAYKRACLLRPDTAPQTRTTSAQTRPVDRSIHGSPGVTSSNEASRKRGPPPSRRDALSTAFDRVMGSH